MSMSAKWDITSRCNLNCKHCCVGGAHYKTTTPELPYARIVEIIDELRRGGVTHIQFVGGEPLLRDDFTDILTRARRAFDTVTLNTNGLFLTPRWLSAHRDRLPDAIIVSLDGPDRESHEFMRGKNTFAPLIDNLRALTSAFADMDTRPRLTLNAVLSRSVRTRAWDFVDLAKTLGVDAFAITDIVTVDNALENRDTIGGISWQDKYAFLIDLIAHAKRESMPVTFEATPMGYAYINAMCATRYPTTFHCGAGSHGMYIQADGTVYPCMRCKFEANILPHESHPVSLAREPLDAFLSSRPRGAFIAAKNEKRAHAPLCSICKFAPHCTPCMFESDAEGNVPECLYIHETITQLARENRDAPSPFHP